MKDKLIDFMLKNPDRRGLSWLDLAVKFNIRPEGNREQRRKAANDIWRNYIRYTPTLTKVQEKRDANGEVISSIHKMIQEPIEVDTSRLQIDKVVTNPYGNSWVTYKKGSNQPDIILSAIERLMEKYPVESIGESIREEISSRIDISQYVAVVNLQDAHLDKLPIKSTCGVESTLEENLKVFKNTVIEIRDYLETVNHISQSELKSIILPVGSDLFHTNGFNSQTKKGTQIEYLCSPEDAYYAICDIITWTIKQFSTICPVKVIMIKGNHDEDKITTLGYWLNRYFAEDNMVDVDFLRRQRKYIKFGQNLIGFAHGDKEKSKIQQLPLIMAQENPQDWADTKYRKFYLGDLHHGFEYQFLKAKDFPGVEVEYLRSVGTTDTWHEDFGFIGIPKTAYVQIFEADEGETTRVKFNIK